MSYFSKDFVKFFKELDSNNNREWFTSNKERYEKTVKEPFFNFVAELLTRMSFDNPSINPDPKDAIFRIYRDIRFSKDKTPYKTHASAVISEGGRKDLNDPGNYFELSHDGIGIYGGLYQLDKNALLKLRLYIASHSKEFNKAITSKKFVSHFDGKILGEKSKRLLPEIAEAAIKQPLIFNTQFYYFKKLPAKLITSDELSDILLEYFDAGKNVNEFLKAGLS